MIPSWKRAEIRRLYTIEGWRKHTIARHLGVFSWDAQADPDRNRLSSRSAMAGRRSSMYNYLYMT